MMKPVSVKEMQQLEQDAFDKGISPDALMENAALLIKKQIIQTYPVKDFTEPIVIFCGSGNNGGDGLALARHLAVNRIQAICVLAPSSRGYYKDLVVTNITRAIDYNVPVRKIDDIQIYEDLVKKAPLVIDAFLGLGGVKSSNPDPLYQEIIDLMNTNENVISIDGPSGINMDDGSFYFTPVKAKETYTLGRVKKGLLSPVAKEFVGNLVLLDIFSGI